MATYVFFTAHEPRNQPESLIPVGSRYASVDINFTCSLYGVSPGGGAVDSNPADDTNLHVGDNDSGYEITIPDGIDEIHVKDPNGDTVVTAPLPPGSPTNLPIGAYLDGDLLIITYGGNTIITYVIPSPIYDAWTVTNIYVGFVNDGVVVPPPGGSYEFTIPMSGFVYESRKIKTGSVGWWSPNVYRASMITQRDIIIGEDDSVTVRNGFRDEEFTDARVIYRGGYDVTIPFDDVVTICNAGYGEYIGVRQ